MKKVESEQEENNQNIKKQKTLIKKNLEYLKLACETFFALEKTKSTVGAVLGGDKKEEARIHLIQQAILLGIIKDIYKELQTIG